MTDTQAALLRSVLLAPADDGPRLVLADWYEENGQPERAEFARARRFDQVWGSFCGVYKKFVLDWLAALPGVRFCGFGRDDDDSRRPYLRFGWAAAGPRNEHNIFVVYRRGWADEVRLPAAAFMEYAPALFAAHPITAVRLTDRQAFRYDGSELRVWYKEGGDPWRVHAEQSRLPDCLFDRLQDWSDGGHREGRWKVYRAGVADDALSAAAVAYGREQAGLPALPAAA